MPDVKESRSGQLSRWFGVAGAGLGLIVTAVNVLYTMDKRAELARTEQAAALAARPSFRVWYVSMSGEDFMPLAGGNETELSAEYPILRHPVVRTPLWERAIEEHRKSLDSYSGTEIELLGLASVGFLVIEQVGKGLAERVVLEGQEGSWWSWDESAAFESMREGVGPQPSTVQIDVGDMDTGEGRIIPLFYTIHGSDSSSPRPLVRPMAVQFTYAHGTGSATDEIRPPGLYPMEIRGRIRTRG
ncbi:MAG: hypothetical protein AMXMBFR53_00050 [Gemmatimonadota bacterium]